MTRVPTDPHSPPTDNRSRILYAAEALFAAQGFSGTSVREIVNRAEVTAPVLYYYFGSKEELLRTLVSERFDQHVERIRHAVVGATTVKGLIDAWYNAVMEGTAQHPTTLRLVLGAMWGPDVQHLHQVVYGFRQETAGLFTDALQRVDPSICETRARFCFMTLSGMINSFAFPVLRLGLPFNVREILQAIRPRIVAIIGDDAPLPTHTIETIERYMNDQLSIPSDESTRGKS